MWGGFSSGGAGAPVAAGAAAASPFSAFAGHGAGAPPTTDFTMQKRRRRSSDEGMGPTRTVMRPDEAPVQLSLFVDGSGAIVPDRCVLAVLDCHTGYLLRAALMPLDTARVRDMPGALGMLGRGWAEDVVRGALGRELCR